MSNENRGADPIDASTPVGQLRLTLGDTASTPFEPDVPGFVNYANWGDDQLEAFLAGAADSVLRAAGNAYMQLAAVYAATGRSTKTDDLAIDTKTRGSDFVAIAKTYFAQADAADESEASDFFEVVSMPCRTPRSTSFALPNSQRGWPL